MRAIKVREEREADQMQGLVGLVKRFFIMGNGKHSLGIACKASFEV